MKTDLPQRMSDEQVVWCWEDGPRDITNPIYGGSTCLLPDGHPGDHEWTPDDQITVEFK